jgi:DNA-binding SARP family transcriptional activator
VDVRILGPLEVRDQGHALRLGGAKQRAVLAMLALRANRVASVELLVDGLWGEGSPPSAVNIVQVYISRLRKILQVENRPGDRNCAVVRRHGPGYLLELDPEVLDLHRFTQLARDGAATLSTAPEVAAEKLAEALALWRGPPLAEFIDEPFAQAEIPRLEEQRLTALTARVEADLTLGRHAQLVGELQALISTHPLVEDLHRQLILSLYRSGRQAEALTAYQRIRRTLAEELGIDAGRPLRDLEAAILAQDPQLDWVPPPSAALPTPLSTDPASRISTEPGLLPVRKGLPDVWNPPPRNPHFTGRDAVLEQLHQRLGSGEGTLVVQALHGLGGVGKTQLALEYAHRFAADYDLVWWLDAEQPVLVPDQLAALAARLDLRPGPTVADTVDRLLAELRDRERWLLIFDNAERPRDIAGYRPGGAGHVLITSRFPGWGALGGRMEVDVLTRAETVALIRSRIPVLSAELADQLAAELGDLPLAAAQAAGYLEQTDLPPADYLRRFRARRETLLARGDVLGYSGRIDTTWALSLERLCDQDPAAVQLLQLAAFLAPEPIPLSLIREHADLLDEPLRSTAADPDTLADTVGALIGYSLARRSPDGFQLHRLVQAVIRHRLLADRQQATAERVVALLTAAFPGDPEDAAGWAAYAELAPHVLATIPLGDHHPGLRHLALDTARYLHAHGDSAGSRAVGAQLLDRWRTVLGTDHPDTLAAASTVSLALFWLGEMEAARALGQDTLQRSHRVLGLDHSGTLAAASTVTLALLWLGEPEPALALGQDTLQRSRRVLGPDHPTVLSAAAALAAALVGAGKPKPARALGQDTLQRSHRALGPDHPTTLSAAAGQTMALVGLGKVEPARALGEDTLQCCRRVLGPDHLTTLLAAAALTHAMVGLGKVEPARELGQDTLQRGRRALGPDHITVLSAATALAAALVEAGAVEPSRALGEDTLQRCRRVLGPDHLITLLAAAALAAALVGAGEVEPARELGQDTLQRSRRVFGPDHPTTLYLAGRRHQSPARR